MLGAFGWRVEGRLPRLPKFVAIGAPHTSNWDWVFAMAAILALGVDARWLGKDSLFRWPLGPLMRRLGGIPVDREVQSGVVSQVASAFRQSDRLILCLAPEGTRREVSRWRTGFYHIAREAGVPILPCSLDYARKVVGLGPTLEPTGDLEADLEEIRSFYQGVAGKRRGGVSGGAG